MANANDSQLLDRKALLALLDASRAINEANELPVVFRRVTEAAANVLAADAASLLILEQERNELVFVTTTGPVSESLSGMRMPAEKGIAGQAIRTGRAVVVHDVRENLNFFDDIDARTAMKTRGLMAAPLVSAGVTLGVIEVLNPIGRDRFTEIDLKLLQVFANMVASGMRHAQQLDRCARENTVRRKIATNRHAVIGSADAFQHVLALCDRVATVRTTVLITGETGTGKEVAARYIHDRSSRSRAPFVAVNCAAISETLLESELFGHEKGAFTGADRDRAGWFELADGGTLFLDEIGELTAATQAKLLRVLQEGEFVRVGGSKPTSCDVRVLTATNRNLEACMQEGTFREDLFYRINVFPVHMPALRERSEDVTPLAEHFLKAVATDMGIAAPTMTPAALEALQKYQWPGNIREFRNVIERCVLLVRDEIDVHHLPRELGGESRMSATGPLVMTNDQQSAGEPDPEVIRAALDEHDWNIAQAARQLNLSRDALRYRMKKLNIEQDQ
ncbi:MAG: sigma 54-interacting transcriptional regulator [Phycisphaerales bacterium]